MKLTINPLDPDSIQAALSALKAHEKGIKDKAQNCAYELAKAGAETARRLYGNSTDVTVTPTSTGATITATGNQVVFMEFGAGAWTKDHELSGPTGIPIYPGSYSETEGAGTWGEWIAAGKDREKYPYNKMPRMAMWEAYKTIEAEQAKIAKQVFEK